MNQQNTLLSFVVGAAIGGAAAYYAFKHKDEILEKINDMEDNLHFDQHEWIEKAKDQLDHLTHTFQSAVQRYSHPANDETKEDEIARLTEELNALRQEMQALKAV
jgi:exonuclease VII large subunit